jgi:tetratricopeptide (TPR) repeat protein
MWLLLLLGFLQLVQGPEKHTKNVQQALSQAEHYIQQIEEGRNADENLWALTLITSDNENVKTFVEQKVREKGLNEGALSLFHNIEDSAVEQLKRVVLETGSADLLIALLLQDVPNKRQLYEDFTSIHTFPGGFSNINYQDLSNAIIANDRVTAEMLPTKSFRLPHFFLLTHPDRRQYLSNSYITQLADQWQNNRSVINRRGPQLPAFTLMQALYLLDRYSQITALYNTLVNDRWFPASSLKLRIYRYLDYAMYRTGYFDRNLTITRNHLLPLTKYTGDKEEELSVRTLLGVYLYSIGKLQRAREVYTQVLEEANNQNIAINRSSLYNNLGITYLKLGEYDRYLDLQFQALETAQKDDNYSHQLEIYNNLFVYYKQTNDFSNALNYIEQAEKLAKELGNPTDLGKIYTFLGSFYRDFQNNFEKAHEYFVDAGKALDPENDSRYYIYFLNEQSQTFEKQQKFEHALEGYNRITELTPQEENPNYIDAVVNKARIHLKQHQVAKAETLVEKFSQLDLSKLNFEQLVKANTVKAQLLHEKGQSDEALAILTPTIEQVVERAQSSTDLQSGFWHVADEYIDAFELSSSIYKDSNQPAHAVSILD